MEVTIDGMQRCHYFYERDGLKPETEEPHGFQEDFRSAVGDHLQARGVRLAHSVYRRALKRFDLDVLAPWGRQARTRGAPTRGQSLFAGVS